MKILILVIIALVICVPIISYASTIGDPETIGKGKFDVGVDSDYIINRNLKAETWLENINMLVVVNGGGPTFSETLMTTSNLSKPKIDSMYSSMAKISYGLFDNLDVYVKLGTSDEQIKSTYSGTGSVNVDFNPGNPLLINQHDGTLRYKTDNNFTYGGGIKLAHEFNGGWILGCSGEYLRADNDYKASASVFSNVPDFSIFNQLNTTDWSGKLTTQEWHIAPYVAKRIANFTPYVGFMYGVLSIKDKSNTPRQQANADTLLTDLSPEGYTLKYQNKYTFSSFVGLNYKFGKRWDVNLEGRFVDETAVSLSGDYKF